MFKLLDSQKERNKRQIYEIEVCLNCIATILLNSVYLSPSYFGLPHAAKLRVRAVLPPPSASLRTLACLYSATALLLAFERKLAVSNSVDV